MEVGGLKGAPPIRGAGATLTDSGQACLVLLIPTLRRQPPRHLCALGVQPSLSCTQE